MACQLMTKSNVHNIITTFELLMNKIVIIHVTPLRYKKNGATARHNGAQVLDSI